MDKAAMFANPIKYLHNYNKLVELGRRQDFLRILSNVDRAATIDRRSAVMPYGFLYADVVSPRMGMPPMGKKSTESMGRGKVKRFTDQYAAFMKIKEHKKEFGDMSGCLCQIDKGENIEDVAFTFKDCIYHAFRVHDTLSMSQSVEQMRGMIGTGGLLSHIRSRPFNTLSNVFGFGQQPII
jgi:hypothetical protein